MGTAAAVSQKRQHVRGKATLTTAGVTFAAQITVHETITSRLQDVKTETTLVILVNQDRGEGA